MINLPKCPNSGCTLLPAGRSFLSMVCDILSIQSFRFLYLNLQCRAESVGNKLALWRVSALALALSDPTMCQHVWEA